MALPHFTPSHSIPAWPTPAAPRPPQILIFLGVFGHKMQAHPDRWPSPLTPPITGWLSQAHVLGVSMFFHSYVISIPSWVNEKSPGVDINGAVWYPSFATAIIKARPKLTYVIRGANPNPVDCSPRLFGVNKKRY